MRWYQVDSDTPNDPKIKRLLADQLMLSATAGRDAKLDAAAVVGHLFLIWCFVANHGDQPGLGVKADGSPLDLDDMAFDAMFPSTEELRRFLDDLAERGLIGKDEWQQGIVFLPAMKSRADAYARSKGRGPSEPPAQAGPGGHGRGRAGGSGPRRATAGAGGPIHDITGQDTTADPDLLADAGQDQVTTLVQVWNTERKPGPQVRDITDRRRTVYGAAMKAQPDLAVWRLVILWLNGQKWCNAAGTGEHPTWRADLDWLAKTGNLGRYHEKALADRPFMRRMAGQGSDTEGRDAGRGRTGFKRGEFAAALSGGDDAGNVH